MSLRQSLQSTVNSVITRALDDVPVQAVFSSVANTGYDPTSGQVVQSVTTYPVTCVQTRVKQTDTPDLVMISSGKKLLVPVLQLANVDVNALDDTVTVGSSSYTIKSVTVDPSGSLYTFIVVAQGGSYSAGR